MSEPVVVVREHGVTHVTLNRPERGNAFALDMVEAALAAVQSAYSDGTRLLVIAGAGKNFCTGLDLGDLDTASDGDLLLRLVRIETLLDAVWCAPCVTMGIGRGRVMGAGADLFTACDRRVAIEGSSYTFPGAVFGVALGTRRLMERIGADLARDMVRSGRVLPHDEALRVGLATIAVPPDAVEPEIIAAQQAASRTRYRDQRHHPPPGAARRFRRRPRRAGALGGTPGIEGPHPRVSGADVAAEAVRRASRH